MPRAADGLETGRLLVGDDTVGHVPHGPAVDLTLDLPLSSTLLDRVDLQGTGQDVEFLRSSGVTTPSSRTFRQSWW